MNKYKKYMQLSILMYVISMIINAIVMYYNSDIKPNEIRTPIVIAGVVNLLLLINLINAVAKYLKEKRLLKKEKHENK